MANSSLKERMTNLNRFSAFEKVGKSVETPVDFDVVIGSSPDRSKASLEEAQRNLNLPIDQLKWGLFWVASTSPAEEVALRNLNAGEISRAISILGKFSTWSAFLSYATLSLMRGDLKGSSRAISSLAKELRSPFLNGLGLETLKLTEEQIIDIYFEELSQSISQMEILKAFEGLSIYGYLQTKVAQRFADTLSTLISKANSCPAHDPEAQLQAGKELMHSARPLIKDLNQTGSKAVYGIMADKLAIQVLEHGITYYNETDDDEAPRKAMPLFEFAAQTAHGQIAKARCQENLNKLKEALDHMPPPAVKNDIIDIQQRLESFGDDTASAEASIRLLEDCAVSLGNIKEKRLLNHPLCVAVSTFIVRKALHSVIADVNNAMEVVNKASSSSTLYRRLNAAKEVLKAAWKATLLMEHFPIEPGSKEWFDKNKTLLMDLIQSTGIYTLSEMKYDETESPILTERERFERCVTKQDFQAYLKLYRHPRYAGTARKNIAEIERAEEEERLRKEEEKRRRQERERRKREEARRKREAEAALCTKINNSSSLDQLWALHAQCNTSTTSNALDERAWALCGDRKDYQSYLAHLPNGIHRAEAIKNARSLGEKLAGYVKGHIGWTIFLSLVLYSMVRAVMNEAPGVLGMLLFTMCFISAIAALVVLYSAYENGKDTKTRLVLFIVLGAIAVACGVGGVAVRVSI